MTEARTADLWLKIDQLHLRFLQVVFNTQTLSKVLDGKLLHSAHPPFVILRRFF